MKEGDVNAGSKLYRKAAKPLIFFHVSPDMMFLNRQHTNSYIGPDMYIASFLSFFFLERSAGLHAISFSGRSAHQWRKIAFQVYDWCLLACKNGKATICDPATMAYSKTLIGSLTGKNMMMAHKDLAKSQNLGLSTAGRGIAFRKVEHIPYETQK